MFEPLTSEEPVAFRKMFKIFLTVLVIFAIMAVACAYADDEAPPSSLNPERDAAVQACYVRGAQQAWGAISRYNDAPRKIIPVTVPEMYEVFELAVTHGFKHSLWFKGVYLAVDPDEHRGEERATNALFGWDVADRLFIPAGETNPGYSMLLARFADFCKTQIK